MRLLAVLVRPQQSLVAALVAKLLSGFIAKQIAKNLGKQLLPCVLIKVTPGVRTPGSIAAGMNPTETPHTARGMIENYSSYSIANSLATAADRKISILGASIAGGVVPASTDKVTIEGVTYRVLEITDRDPDGAMFTLKCRI